MHLPQSSRALIVALVFVPVLQSGTQSAHPQKNASPDRAATLTRVSGLVERDQFAQALSAYDEFTVALKKPDPALLAVIARAELKRLPRARSDEPILVAGALERLARDGNTGARAELNRAAKAVSPSATSARDLAPLLSLVRLGDEEATARLGGVLDGTAQKADVIRIIQDVGARSLAPKVAALLSAGEPQVRSTAALAVGVLQFKAAVPKLQELFDKDVGVVRMFAAAGLKRLGQRTADIFLAEMLQKDLPEIRLVAGEAYQNSATAQWVPYVKSVLTDPNEMHRLRAAELLACCDQPAARSALMDALKSENPSLRAGAAEILEKAGLADIKAARQMLGDASDGVRMHGAGSALRAATATGK
jgi:hypothetical protein